MIQSLVKVVKKLLSQILISYNINKGPVKSQKLLREITDVCTLNVWRTVKKINES